MSEKTLKVGDVITLKESIYDDGCENHHPPGYLAFKGDKLVVRRVSRTKEFGLRIHVSHEHIKNRTFWIYSHEYR